MWKRRSSKHDGGLVTDIAKGAIAGAFGTWMMGYATTFLYEREDARARQREEEARGGKTAFGIAAEKAGDAVGHPLSEEERARYGAAVHWALGAGAGATYAALRPRVAGTDLGHGLLFGTAFWAVVDEGANAALGLTPGPAAFPWEAHARGLAGHLVFGLAADTAVRALDRVV